MDNIRNFSIIAHIDHGKSTLADRLIEETGTLHERQMEDQVLDNMDLERERGITIKLQPMRLEYEADDKKTYILNLIDTPGHVDFSYEVSRSLAACEGAILVVDAAQGIEAQTLANVYLAIEQDLEIVPVINKIDLPSADIARVKEEIEEVIGLDTEGIPLISAKNGTNIKDVLEAIVKEIPPPDGNSKKPLKALLFDSIYDQYKGVICYIRVFDGQIKKDDQIQFMQNGQSFIVDEVGYVKGGHKDTGILKSGEVGYFTAAIRDVKYTSVGDTITSLENPTDQPLPGYIEATPMVYCGIYPTEGEEYSEIRDALEKLQINDASLSFEQESSSALGFGYRCGFLGLLHMEIIQERLEREFDLDIITTAPSVIYRITKTDGQVIEIQNPANMPEPQEIDKTEEPMVDATIMTPSSYIGTVMELCQDRRGSFVNIEYIDESRANVEYVLPLNEVVYDFFDALKSSTAGYASLDYEFKGYEESDLVKLDILVNEEVVDALSLIVHKDKAYERGRSIVRKLKDEIPRHQFAIPIQAAIGNKIIARETISALRKDVTSKCYGGDISRKKKLLEKQKEGKKRMRQIGNVEIPQEAFLSVLKYDED